MPDDRLGAKGPGRSNNGNVVLTNFGVGVTLVAEPNAAQTRKLKSAWADFSQQDFGIELSIDEKPESGWAVLPEVGKPHSAVFVLDQPLNVGQDARLSVSLAFISKFAQHQLGRFRLSVTDAPNPQKPDYPDLIMRALATAAVERTEAQKAELRNFYRDHLSTQIKELKEHLSRVRQSRDNLEKQIPTTMVMHEMSSPRDTFMLVRGQYDKQGEKVTPGVPEALTPLPAGARPIGWAWPAGSSTRPTRLRLRVAANRYWQMFFGTGLVKTAEDFGSQGELPSHPELLDWLAVEFAIAAGGLVTTGCKALCRLIVTSATYRQTSVVDTRTAGAGPGEPPAGPRPAAAAAGGIHSRPGPGGQRAA